MATDSFRYPRASCSLRCSRLQFRQKSYGSVTRAYLRQNGPDVSNHVPITCYRNLGHRSKASTIGGYLPTLTSQLEACVSLAKCNHSFSLAPVLFTPALIHECPSRAWNRVTTGPPLSSAGDGLLRATICIEDRKSLFASFCGLKLSRWQWGLRGSFW